MKDCNHKISRGIDCRRGEFFSYCMICGEKWNDNGKRWEKQNKENKNEDKNKKNRPIN